MYMAKPFRNHMGAPIPCEDMVDVGAKGDEHGLFRVYPSDPGEQRCDTDP